MKKIVSEKVILAILFLLIFALTEVFAQESDITERTKDEELLIESEKQLRKMNEMLENIAQNKVDDKTGELLPTTGAQSNVPLSDSQEAQSDSLSVSSVKPDYQTSSAELKPEVAETSASDSISVESKKPPEEDLADYSRPKLLYESGQNRDPFETLMPEKVAAEKKIKGIFDYEGAAITGIVNTEDDEYALVVDADNFSYVLREGYKIFGGYVTLITEDALHLYIVKYGRANNIVMRLESSKSTVTSEIEQGGVYVQRPGINIAYKRDGHAQAKISVDDVNIPSFNIITIEEQWFGGKETVTDPEEILPSDSESETFTLYDPPDNTIIAIPYVLNWTEYEGKDIRYTLYIDDDADYSSPVFIKAGIETSSFLLTEDIKLPLDQKLFWKVIVNDSEVNQVVCRRTDMSFIIR